MCGDVVGQVLDLEALLLRGELDEVADRDDADDLAVVDDRDVTDAPSVIGAMHSSTVVCGVATISGAEMISPTAVSSSVRPSSVTRRR